MHALTRQTKWYRKKKRIEKRKEIQRVSEMNLVKSQGMFSVAVRKKPAQNRHKTPETAGNCRKPPETRLQKKKRQRRKRIKRIGKKKEEEEAEKRAVYLHL